MTEIRFACGVCGTPLDENKNAIKEIPEGYNPNDFELTYCDYCENENYAMEQYPHSIFEESTDE
jgi:hypothetical protein